MNQPVILWWIIKYPIGDYCKMLTSFVVIKLPFIMLKSGKLKLHHYMVSVVSAFYLELLKFLPLSAPKARGAQNCG